MSISALVLSILYLRCTNPHFFFDIILPAELSFNSLFEMRTNWSRMAAASYFSFNSLFEMPQCRPPGRGQEIRETFNSLFEMREGIIFRGDRCYNVVLSILYLRCGLYHDHYLFVNLNAFQFSI